MVLVACALAMVIWQIIARQNTRWLLTRGALLGAATAIHVSDRTLDSHLRNLRAKLKGAGCDSAIETVHGVGIRMGLCRQNKTKMAAAAGAGTGVHALAVLCLPAIGILLWPEIYPATGWRNAKLLVGAGILLTTGGIGFVLWRVLLRPITAPAERAEAIKYGQSDALTPMPHCGTAELRDLGQAVLDMGATLQDREAGLRADTDHVTHELKSPLGADQLTITAGDQNLTVHDNGTGIAPGNRGRIFDPFFTTRRRAGGTGMGLTIVRTMLQAAGGTIRLNPVRQGHKVRHHLPRFIPRHPRPGPRAASQPRAAHRP